MADEKPNSLVLGALEGVEAFVDFISTNEAIKAVPVVSSAARFLEGIKDVRSQLLQRKLRKFLDEPSLLRSLKAQKLRNEIVASPDDLVALGDTLFMVIDKVTDGEKPVILAKIYAHLLDGGITLEEFYLLAHCVDICALLDLRNFINVRRGGFPISLPGKKRLVAAGLFETQVTNSTMLPSVMGTSNNNVRTYFEITHLGDSLIRAIDAANVS